MKVFLNFKANSVFIDSISVHSICFDLEIDASEHFINNPDHYKGVIESGIFVNIELRDDLDSYLENKKLKEEENLITFTI